MPPCTGDAPPQPAATATWRDIKLTVHAAFNALSLLVTYVHASFPLFSIDEDNDDDERRLVEFNELSARLLLDLTVFEEELRALDDDNPQPDVMHVLCNRIRDIAATGMQFTQQMLAARIYFGVVTDANRETLLHMELMGRGCAHVCAVANALRQ
jgi:hypothetical protein